VKKIHTAVLTTLLAIIMMATATETQKTIETKGIPTELPAMNVAAMRSFTVASATLVKRQVFGPAVETTTASCETVGVTVSNLEQSVRSLGLSVNVYDPEVRFWIYVGVYDIDGNEIAASWKYSKLEKVDGQWILPKEAAEVKLSLNNPFIKFDGVESVQIIVKDGDGNIIDDIYLYGNGNGFWFPSWILKDGYEVTTIVHTDNGDTYVYGTDGKLVDPTDVKVCTSTVSVDGITEFPVNSTEIYMDSKKQGELYVVEHTSPDMTVKLYYYGKVSPSAVWVLPFIKKDGVLVSLEPCRFQFDDGPIEIKWFEGVSHMYLEVPTAVGINDESGSEKGVQPGTATISPPLE